MFGKFRDSVLERGGDLAALAPQDKDINIYFIASVLSKICRFGGQCNFHYSVAQHSVYVSRLLPKKLQLLGLLHDASEAYLTDIITPIKYLPEMSFYLELEEQVQTQILNKFDLNPDLMDEIKAADSAIVLDEFDQVVGARPGALKSLKAPGTIINPMSPLEAESFFLNAYKELTNAKQEETL